MPNFKQETSYIYSVILKDYLGLETSFFTISEYEDRLTLSRGEKRLVLGNDFFSQNPVEYLSNSSLPNQPLLVLELSKWDLFSSSLEESSLPIIYGNDFVSIQESEVSLGLDIFGSCFFMLTRYEEYVNKERDSQDRFSAFSSIAFKNGFLERPIVDEYVELLWSSINFLWSDLKRKPHQFKQLLSCDVDFVWDRRLKFPKVAKTILGDLLKRKSLVTTYRTMKNYLTGNNPFDTFDFLMSTCERSNAQLAFYFISRDNKELIDGDYDISEQYARSLIQEIYERGHEIGLHPSYYTYRDLKKTEEEKNTLSNLIKEMGLDINILGGRQHYLRWSTPETARNWEAIGLIYDSTLGYPDHVGFRCGTCREYKFYDVVERKPLNLIIRPLIAMEVTLLSKEYMNLSADETLKKLNEIKNTCKKFNGNFVLLWHNNYFDKPEYFTIYKNIVAHES